MLVPRDAGADGATSQAPGPRACAPWRTRCRPTVEEMVGGDGVIARYYPEDDEFLLDREPTVAHFEVAPARA